MAYVAINATRPLAEKILAITLSLIVVVFASAVAVNYFSLAPSQSATSSSQREALLREKREAYDWISHFTAADVRFVAYEDACLYLYTDRPASRPFTFTMAEFYDPPLLESDLDHITDVARAIGAEYWVSSEDDYGFEWQEAYTTAHARTRALEQILPLVFRSRHNHVRVYFIGCLQHPELSSCKRG